MRSLLDPLPFRSDSPDDRSDLRAAVDEVLARGAFLDGSFVDALETAFGASLERDGVDAVAVGSGTDALVLALLAVGVEPGDEVIVPSFTFIATGGAVQRIGASPVVVDVRPEDLTIDPAAAGRARSSSTRAVVPVHLFGQPAAVPDLATELDGIAIVEDGAQCVPAAVAGDVGCFSFHPSKILGGVGNGGMVTVPPSLAGQIRTWRRHGLGPNGTSVGQPGLNTRMGEIEAAFLVRKLGRLHRLARERVDAAERYDALLAEVPGVEPLRRAAGSVPTIYAVRVPSHRRAGIRRELAAAGVETAVYYERPLHRQPALGSRIAPCPVADEASGSVLCLPLAGVAAPSQQRVVDGLGHAS